MTKLARYGNKKRRVRFLPARVTRLTSAAISDNSVQRQRKSYSGILLLGMGSSLGSSLSFALIRSHSLSIRFSISRAGAFLVLATSRARFRKRSESRANRANERRGSTPEDKTARATKGPERSERRRRERVRGARRGWTRVHTAKREVGSTRRWCATPATGARQTTFNERL